MTVAAQPTGLRMSPECASLAEPAPRIDDSPMPASFLFYDLETFGADPRTHAHRPVRRDPHRRRPEPDRRADQLFVPARRRPAALARRHADHRHHAAAGAARGHERGRSRSPCIFDEMARPETCSARLQLAALRRRVRPLRPVPQLLRRLRARVARRQLALGPARRDAPGPCRCGRRAWSGRSARTARTSFKLEHLAERQRRAQRRRARGAVGRARADRPGAQAQGRRSRGCGTTRCSLRDKRYRRQPARRGRR